MGFVIQIVWNTDTVVKQGWKYFLTIFWLLELSLVIFLRKMYKNKIFHGGVGIIESSNYYVHFCYHIWDCLKYSHIENL